VTLEGHHAFYAESLERKPSAVRLRQALTSIVELTGLHAIARPAVVTSGEDWHALVMIAESHIAFEGRGTYGLADVFSCAPFDSDGMLAALRETLPGHWWQQGRLRRDHLTTLSTAV